MRRNLRGSAFSETCAYPTTFMILSRSPAKVTNPQAKQEIVRRPQTNEGRAMQRRETDASTLAVGSSIRNADQRLEHSSNIANATTAGDPGAGQHGGKRQKTRPGMRDQCGGGLDSTVRKRKRLLADAAKISSGEDSLKSFLELVTCVQATEILKVSCSNKKSTCACT